MADRYRLTHLLGSDLIAVQCVFVRSAWLHVAHFIIKLNHNMAEKCTAAVLKHRTHTNTHVSILCSDAVKSLSRSFLTIFTPILHLLLSFSNSLSSYISISSFSLPLPASLALSLSLFLTFFVYISFPPLHFLFLSPSPRVSECVLVAGGGLARAVKEQ